MTKFCDTHVLSKVGIPLEVRKKIPEFLKDDRLLFYVYKANEIDINYVLKNNCKDNIIEIDKIKIPGGLESEIKELLTATPEDEEKYQSSYIAKHDIRAPFNVWSRRNEPIFSLVFKFNKDRSKIEDIKLKFRWRYD